MQTNNRNQNKPTNSNLAGAQLPYQVAADEIIINVENVNYSIEKLSAFNDAYSLNIIKVFKEYLIHKSFDKMREELLEVPSSRKPLYNLWDISTNVSFLDVIYPEVTSGGELI